MSDPISLIGLDKAEVLAALYNASKPLGLQHPHMTREEAAEILQQAVDYRPSRVYFDCLQGRVLKVDLTGDKLEPQRYDRDNGEGAAERAIAPLRKQASP